MRACSSEFRVYYSIRDGPVTSTCVSHCWSSFGSTLQGKTYFSWLYFVWGLYIDWCTTDDKMNTWSQQTHRHMGYWYIDKFPTTKPRTPTLTKIHNATTYNFIIHELLKISMSLFLTNYCMWNVKWYIFIEPRMNILSILLSTNYQV